MTIRKPFLQILLLAMVLLLYYPSIWGEITYIDDTELFMWLKSVSTFNLLDIFIPGSAGGLYYRPITVLSYLVSWKIAHGFTEVMHFFNILIHAANSILFFALASRITPKATTLNFLAATLFAVHPLATESVCWISGRTDLLAGFFLFASTWFLLSYREDGRFRHLIPALLLLLCATLAKEFAIAFVPGMLLIMYNRDVKSTGRAVLRFAIYGAMTVALFFLLRKFAFTSNYGTIRLTTIVMQADYLHTLEVFLKSTAFYLKKIFWPIPIDFAIEGIHYVYSYIAWPLLLILCIIMTRFNLASALFSSAIFLLGPSFIIAFGQIAWVPYAERYAYIPSAFVILSAVAYAQKSATPVRIKFIYSVMTLLIALFSVATFKRSFQWKDNLVLLEDTYKTNPDSREISTGMGGMLMEKGYHDKAIPYLEAAETKTQRSISYDARASNMLAEIYFLKGDKKKSLAKINEVLKRTKDYNFDALELKSKVLASMILVSSEKEKKGLIYQKIDNYKQLYRITKNSKYLYLTGINYVAVGESAKGKRYLKYFISCTNTADPLYAKAKLLLS